MYSIATAPLSKLALPRSKRAEFLLRRKRKKLQGKSVRFFGRFFYRLIAFERERCYNIANPMQLQLRIFEPKIRVRLSENGIKAHCMAKKEEVQE